MKAQHYAIAVSVVSMLIGAQVYAVALDTRAEFQHRKANGQVAVTLCEVMEVAASSSAWVFAKRPT